MTRRPGSMESWWVKSQSRGQHESWRLFSGDDKELAMIVCRQDRWLLASPGLNQRLLATDLESAQREAVRLIRARAQQILDATAAEVLDAVSGGRPGP